MIHILQLVRYKNLSIIIATMLVVRYGLILPMLQQDYEILNVELDLQFSLFHFILLMIATVSLSASGYIINDYFDVNADMMNKPDKVIIGKYIHRRFAMFLHWFLNIVGVICGGIASYAIGFPHFVMIFVFIAGLLWFYSTTFSREPFIGNILIAVLVALVPLITAVYELLPLNFMYKHILNTMYVSFEGMLFWSLGYALFAFLLTLIREMVKDIEDLEGDAAYGRNTIPIAFGIEWARYITISVFVVTIGALLFVLFAYLQQGFAQLYMIIGIIIPLILTLILFIVSNSAQTYHRVSTLLKIIMILGLLYIISKNILF
ncbi:MAG TPA: geranylgeranylglycerol-phosphate geranylgeranyltransferase [Bacteroidales bacterium]|jgi:4-hydroxybenzoate polyprenyltransferase|nr:geranylgeranylglycerol-phosphate geranylgeranyltransferase [Bacteroidales bacterium]HRS18309.1 geranylgeranylglycerol-phosphate geranylgeranyltransferase [Bacteroidales bacterium]